MKNNKKSKYKYIFGPVKSRRLGISLGIDLIPHKICSFDCIYCECGKTTTKTISREPYFKASDILAELDDFLKGDIKLDYITLGGSGEPLLNLDIDKIIAHIKDNYPEYKVAVLTNASPLVKKEVRKSLLRADLVLPSLDACTQDLFDKINRPVSEVKIEDIINGLIEFRNEFKGQIWLEIFIVPGLNDTDNEINLKKHYTDLIKPDRIQLNTLDRPGTETSLEPKDIEKLNPIAKFFDEPDIISRDKTMSRYENQNWQETILSTLKRRPCTIDDLVGVSDVNEHEVILFIKEKIEQNLIESVSKGEHVFYKILSDPN